MANPNLRSPKHIAIVGGGPACLLLLKNLLQTEKANFSMEIFEAGTTLGVGFPYSRKGAGPEHITNVSGNEIPELVTGTMDWLKTVTPERLNQYGINIEAFNDYHVFPRLLFGEYLQAQFELLLEKAAEKNIAISIHFNSCVTDIKPQPDRMSTNIHVGDQLFTGFTHVIICSGHSWQTKNEGKQPGWFDSPYPPAKLNAVFNHRIAIKGSSLTAIDAVRTLAVYNGQFSKDETGKLIFRVNEQGGNFHITMYSIKGLLPGVRFHLEDSHLSGGSLLTEEAIQMHRRENKGFVSLDFIFDHDFKEQLRGKDTAFYDHIRNMTMEQFVTEMMNIREQADPFQLLKAEYEEARLSIRRRQSVYWKEMLGALSAAMNYPAKYFSAEDMQRLQQILMPLISVIIAYAPQDSCEELLALHEAGRLSVIAVEKDSHADPHPNGGVVYHHTDELGKPQQHTYPTYIDCAGQPPLWMEDFPFPTLVREGYVSQALLPYRTAKEGATAMNENPEKVVLHDDQYYLKVPGIAINDAFAVINKDGRHSNRIYIMAVPFIGGFNPDYSGLDFCEAASAKIAGSILGE